MLRIAICNGSAAYGGLVEGVICEWAQQRQINIQTRRFVTGEEILADIEQTGYYHIVLMDTCLSGKMSGIKTAETIRQIYEYFCLIFMSREERYDKEIFRLHPFRYFEVPIVRGNLYESLNQAVDRYQLMCEIFVFRFKGMTYCIRLSEVLYFVSDRRIIRIRMECGREYVFYGKLAELEKELEKYTIRFFRIHQSYLVNGRQIEQYHSKYVVMRNREMIPVSTDRRGSIPMDRIKNYIYGC